MVQNHISDDLANYWTELRGDFYENAFGKFTPHMIYDGWVEGPVLDWYLWESTFLARQAVPTDVTIDLEANIDDTLLDITATVCVEAGGTTKQMRINMVQMLGHWPTEPTYLRNTCIEGASAGDVWVSPGQCVEVSHQFLLTGQSLVDPDDIRIAVWAQDPLTIGPAEVFQAAKMDSVPRGLIFIDGFETGDASLWSNVVP